MKLSVDTGRALAIPTGITPAMVAQSLLDNIHDLLAHRQFDIASQLANSLHVMMGIGAIGITAGDRNVLVGALRSADEQWLIPIVEGLHVLT